MVALRIFLFSGLVLMGACSSEPAEPADACTEAFCECTLATDCDPGLTCSQGICLPSAADVQQDPNVTNIPDASSEDVVPTPDVAPEEDVTEEVVEDDCVVFCEARLACGLEGVPGLEEDCSTACVQFAAVVTEGASGSANPVACVEALLASTRCFAAVTDCEQLEASDRGEATVCVEEEANRDVACSDGGEVPPDEGSAPPDEGSAPPDEGSAPPDEGSAPPDEGSASPGSGE
jgi:hypothetical protein